MGSNGFGRTGGREYGGECGPIGGLPPGGKVVGGFLPGRNGTILLAAPGGLGLIDGIVEVGGLMALAPTGGIGKRPARGNDIRL